jgi:Zn-dependent protease with chaperone function
MYPRLWVPQLRGHILSNLGWNTALLLGLLSLYLVLPQIVAIGHSYLRGSGYLPSEFEQRFFDDHWKIIGLTALFAFGAAEVQGYLLRRAKAEPFVNASFQALIAELAKRAQLPYTPAIIFVPHGPVNAAATQSLFFGGKVLVMGDVLERLDAGEERIVFAHEISHLVNRDIWPMLVLRIGSGGIAWQKWGLLIAIVTLSHRWVAEVIQTMELSFPRELSFLLVAWLITTAVHAVYKLGEMAHSRGREYLADVGAVALTGWENRVQLITALLKIGHGQTGRSPFRLLRRTGLEIFMPHPAIIDRAEVLEVPLPRAPDEEGSADHLRFRELKRI